MEKIFKKLYSVLACILVVSTISLIFAIPPYVKSEKKVDFFSATKIAENIKNMEMNLTSVVLVEDENGGWKEYKRLHGDENRIWVGISRVPKNLQNAFIAIEDETFYEHKGVNWRRTFGAIGNYVFKFDETEFGGSTITQQLIKNVTSDKSRDAFRKFREIIRAMLIENRLDKTEILEAYLNTIALGNGICGVQVAANYYFNKDVEELSLVECAAIAAITQNPSRYNLLTGAAKNKERRNTVLDKMFEIGSITEKEYLEAYDKDITLDTSREEKLDSDINNYFIDALIEELISDLAKKYGCSESVASTMLYNGGYKIYATVKPEIQSSMEKVYENTGKYFYLKGENLQGEKVHVQSAMTIMDYEGHIVGLVGGAGEKTVNRGLNRATAFPRQPGSTMKPIGVYALAVEKDMIDYTSIVKDEPIEKYYPDGKPGPAEWYGYYKNDITVDYAIRKSANTIPVKLLKDIGVEDSFDFLKNKLKMSYLVDADKNLSSLALGGCHYGITTTESAAAYAIFGNNGKFYEPTTYFKIVDPQGDTVLEYDYKGDQVISEATATIMNHLLQGVVYGSEGTGGGIAGFSSMKAYAKTGTSSESKDLWMVAGSPYYVGSVWYGFDKQQEIHSTSAAATVWREVMRQVHKGLEFKSFTDSEDVYKKGSGYYKNGTTPSNFATITGTASSEESEVSSTTPSSSETSSSSSTSSSTSSEGTTSEPPTSSEGTSSEIETPSESTPEQDSSSGNESGGESSSEIPPATPSQPTDTPENQVDN
jgi:penicillin-binding protein 1A